MAGRDIRLASDHDIRSLDESGRHTSFDVELSVAMEEPDTRVVGYEADRNSDTRIHDNNVTAHGRGRDVIETRPLRFVACTVDDLELMAVEMEGMGAFVMVVEVDFYDLSVLQNLCVDLAVDLGVLLIGCGCCQGSEERWDLKTKLVVEINPSLRWLSLPSVGCKSSHSQQHEFRPNRSARNLR